ncbi:hypothetical protein [Nocardia cyriacigeorgica]|uniref:hypothetical protein n=1 Tax=Nocardia cyriacigeorgica TaxID=135487 RepID=UPI002456F278|nr:hypothetical protein [Nocardia cyriacigeorgica]
MGRQDETGRHEGYVAHVFADGMYGGGWSGGGPTANYTPDGVLLPYEQRQTRTADEIVAWRPICGGPGGRSCWHGQLWARVTDPAEHDPAARKLYSPYITGPAEDDEDLMMREWQAHIAPMRGTADVEDAAAEVVEAQRRLNEAVVAARAQGASWEAIGRAAGMSRQSAHERWSAAAEHARVALGGDDA